MAFNLTIEGTITDTNTDPVDGMTVNMIESPSGSTVQTTTTDGTGSYSLTITDAESTGEETYRADPLALDPHYLDPGAGSFHAWDGASNKTVSGEDFVADITNENPTRSTVGNQTFTEDSGLISTPNRTMSDPDSGDVLTPVKTDGASWGTIVKVDNSTYRWDFQTNTPAPNVYGFSYRIDDDWGGSSTVENFNVTIEEGNNPPDLVNPGTKRFTQNTGVQQFSLSASDPDGNLASSPFSKVSGQSWATVNATSGAVSVDTDVAGTGNFGHTWRASDAEGLTDDENHTIEITDFIRFWPYYHPAEG